MVVVVVVVVVVVGSVWRLGGVCVRVCACVRVRVCVCVWGGVRISRARGCLDLE